MTRTEEGPRANPLNWSMRLLVWKRIIFIFVTDIFSILSFGRLQTASKKMKQMRDNALLQVIESEDAISIVEVIGVDNIHDYLLAVADGLTQSVCARAAYEKAEAGALDMSLIHLKYAQQHLVSGIQVLRPYEKSTNEYIKASAQTFCHVFSGVWVLYEEEIDERRDCLNGIGISLTHGLLAAQYADRIIRVDFFWRTLPMAFKLSIWAVRDASNQEFLRLTQEQRSEVICKFETLVAQLAPKETDYIKYAASLFLKFLKNEQYKSVSEEGIKKTG